MTDVQFVETSTVTSYKEAQTLTGQIRQDIKGSGQLIMQAHKLQIWKVLGYPGWDDYCAKEFGPVLGGLAPRERREMMSSLRKVGMTTRAIAAVTGDHYSTVSRKTKSTVAFATVDKNRQVTGRNGKDYSTVTVAGVAGRYSKAAAKQLNWLPERQRAQCVKEILSGYGVVTAAKVKEWQSTPRHLAAVPPPTETPSSSLGEAQPVEDGLVRDWAPEPACLADYPEGEQEKVREHVHNFIQEHGIRYARAFEYGLTEAIFDKKGESWN